MLSLFILIGASIGVAFLIFFADKRLISPKNNERAPQPPIPPTSPEHTVLATASPTELGLLQKIEKLESELGLKKERLAFCREERAELLSILSSQKLQLLQSKSQLISTEEELDFTKSQLRLMQNSRADKLKEKLTKAAAANSLTKTPSILFTQKPSIFELPRVILNPSDYTPGSRQYYSKIVETAYNILSSTRQRDNSYTIDGIPVSHKIIFSINEEDVPNISKSNMLADVLSTVSNAKKFSSFTEKLMGFIWDDPETILVFCTHPISPTDTTLGSHVSVKSSHISSVIFLKQDPRLNYAKTLIHEATHRLLYLYNPGRSDYGSLDDFQLPILVEVIENGIKKLLAAIEHAEKPYASDINYVSEKELESLHNYVPHITESHFKGNFYEAIKQDHLFSILNEESYKHKKEINGKWQVIVEEVLPTLAFQAEEFLNYFFPGIFDFFDDVLQTAIDNLLELNNIPTTI